MLKYYATKYGLYASLSLTALHLTSHAYLGAEEFARARLGALTNHVIATIAVQNGYEPRLEPTPQADILAFADIEARRQSVNPSLVRAVMKAESNHNHRAISSAGALGRMQVMPFNAKACGLNSWLDLADERNNVACGIQILKSNLQAQNGDPIRALQAYNGGPKCIDRCKESVQYAQTVLRYWSKD